VVVAGAAREPARTLARRCEELGFDSLWAGDHIAFHVPILESLSLLSFLAGATERVLLGTSVYLLPLRRPAVAAKSVATLDVLSGVWSEDAVEHHGRHFSFGPVTMDPKPVQAGGPPIWIGGRRPPAFRRAGRLGDGYISHMCATDTYRANLETIAGHAEAAGRTLEHFDTAAFLFAAVDDVYEKALDRAAAVLAGVYARPVEQFRETAPRYVLLGRPEDCLEQMRGFHAAGVRHFVLSPLSDPQAFAERVGVEILPELSALAG
jgi:alkanesulfonate monooxygenase SsuD/methylene tetrahydromethanopterin reductase-like flavin-dependent oxidoreductase (luciferase family)